MTPDDPSPIGAQAPRSRLDALADQAVATIAAVLADPAVPARDRADIALQVLRLGSAASGNTAVPAVSGPHPAPSGAPLPLAFVTIPDFLPPDLHAAAIAAALAERDRFEPSTVIGQARDPGSRRSQVRFAATFPAMHDALRREIDAVLPSVFAGIGRAPFVPGEFELHMTAHGDGDFYRMHGDATAPETATREITFVYYFMPRLPRGFSGGALRLYQTWDSTTPYDIAQFHDIEPTDNMIVFFDSRLLHEVRPVTVPSGEFQDGRFTLNGWLHRQEA